MSKQIKEKYEVYLEAVTCLGYGAEEIFPKYVAKILAENVKRSDKQLYARRLWEFLIDRQKILNADYDRENQANAKIKAWQNHVTDLKHKMRDTPKQAYAQQEKLFSKIRFIEGRIAEHREICCFSPKWLEHMKSEGQAIEVLVEYLSLLSETQRLSKNTVNVR